MYNILDLPQNMTFSDVFPTSEDFIGYFNESPFKATTIATLFDNATLELIYVLLYNAYGNNEIINNSVNQFKSKLIGIMWANGPRWIQELKIQEKIASLGLADGSEIYKGSTAIYNHAMHDETAPGTGTTDELSYINDQNVTKYKKSVLEGLNNLSLSLSDNYTNEFISKFKKLFKMFVWRNRGPIFVEEEENEEA